MQNANTKCEDLNPRPLVLVVDDEHSICDTLCRVLDDENFSTIVAHDGLDALEKLYSFKPDLIFLDIWMPGSDGIETLEKIKSISPDTEVIMMSGHATISSALEATKRGAFDFIEKPLNIDSIIISSNRALERNRKNRAYQDPRTPQMYLVPGARDELHRGVNSLFSHPGVLSTGCRGRNLGQRTIKKSGVLYGHCLHSGLKSGLVLEPLPVNSGIHFVKMGSASAVPAFVDYVQSTEFATTVRSGTSAASTIEHLMAALHAYKICNVLVKCNGEVPIFDGSSLEFCRIIDELGIEEQGGEWFEIVPNRKITQTVVPRNPAVPHAEPRSFTEEISIEPASDFSITYELDYPSPIGAQSFHFKMSSIEDFVTKIAPARTFGLLRDIERLQKAGLAAGGRLDNFILIGDEDVINTKLRFPDELVRHKILDIIGDLFLIGRPLVGHVHARMTGHSDNINLLKMLYPETTV